MQEDLIREEEERKFLRQFEDEDEDEPIVETITDEHAKLINLSGSDADSEVDAEESKATPASAEPTDDPEMQ